MKCRERDGKARPERGDRVDRRETRGGQKDGKKCSSVCMHVLARTHVLMVSSGCDKVPAMTPLATEPITAPVVGPTPYLAGEHGGRHGADRCALS